MTKIFSVVFIIKFFIIFLFKKKFHFLFANHCLYKVKTWINILIVRDFHVLICTKCESWKYCRTCMGCGNAGYIQQSRGPGSGSGHILLGTLSCEQVIYDVGFTLTAQDRTMEVGRKGQYQKLYIQILYHPKILLSPSTEKQFYNYYVY